MTLTAVSSVEPYPTLPDESVALAESRLVQYNLKTASVADPDNNAPDPGSRFLKFWFWILLKSELKNLKGFHFVILFLSKLTPRFLLENHFISE